MILGVICKACDVGKQWPVECNLFANLLWKEKMYFMSVENAKVRALLYLRGSVQCKRGYITSGGTFC